MFSTYMILQKTKR